MNIFTPKAALFDSHIERAKFLMVYRLTLFFTFIFFCLSLLFYKKESYSLTSYLIVFGITSGALFYLIFTKKHVHLFQFYAIAGSCIAQASCFFSLDTNHHDDFMWMLVCSLLAYVGMGKYWGMFLLGLNSIGIAFFIFYRYNSNIELLTPFTIETATIAYVELVFAFLVFGYLMHQFLSIQNLSEAKLRKANIDLAYQNSVILAKNNENITLIKEIHHRVKNNLQIIISLLRLQQSEIKHQETKDQFTEAINRVMVMSSIHQRLYQEKDIARIELKSYLTDMANDLKLIFENEKAIQVNIETALNEIDLKTVVPLGLLLNELISNSYKYAFTNQEKGLINIRINESVKNFSLHYHDNGKWKEPSKNASGFGLDLITILTEQLNGKCIFETNATGTHYWFDFDKTI